MHSKFSALLISAGLFVAAPVFAAEHAEHDHNAKEQPVSKADAAAIEKARANYPLKTCIVSGDSLGSMGEATGYVHKEAGKPDRVVFFCCDGCVDDFKKDPGLEYRRVLEFLELPDDSRTDFDIHAESDPLRDAYGRNTLGQSCLMARRLVEAGVRCVTVDHSNLPMGTSGHGIWPRAALVTARRAVSRMSSTRVHR